MSHIIYDQIQNKEQRNETRWNNTQQSDLRIQPRFIQNLIPNNMSREG